mgnify:CR=1 FL=1
MERKQEEHNASLGVSWVDVHCHVLFGLDDGPRSLSESLELCKALVADGVGSVIATPHQLGRFEGLVRAELIKKKVEQLNNILKEEQIPLNVYPGADIRLDERVLEMLSKGEVLSLAGSRYVLLEIPHEIFLDPLPIVRSLRKEGYLPVISHPERHRIVLSNPRVVDSWLSEGAYLQVTAGSLAGHFGKKVQELSFAFVCQGKAAFIASDAHNTQDRSPAFTEAALQIAGTIGADALMAFFEKNPRRVLEDEVVEHVAIGPSPQKAKESLSSGENPGRGT